MDLISPSLLANIQKCSKECHEQLHLGMGNGLNQATKVPQRMRHLSRSHQRKGWSLVCQTSSTCSKWHY